MARKPSIKYCAIGAVTEGSTWDVTAQSLLFWVRVGGRQESLPRKAQHLDQALKNWWRMVNQVAKGWGCEVVLVGKGAVYSSSVLKIYFKETLRGQKTF